MTPLHPDCSGCMYREDAPTIVQHLDAITEPTRGIHELHANSDEVLMRLEDVGGNLESHLSAARIGAIENLNGTLHPYATTMQTRRIQLLTIQEIKCRMCGREFTPKESAEASVA